MGHKKMTITKPKKLLKKYKPGEAIEPTSGTTISVPVKSQRSPACAVSTASARNMTSTLKITIG